MKNEFIIISNLSKISEDLGYELKKLEEMRKMPCADDENSIKDRENMIKRQSFLVDKLAIQKEILLDLFKD